MKRFYKFFNKTECHFGFQYKTGLNIDPIQFNRNPTYECGKGGLYFSDATNIMTFIDGGMAYIREVEVPEEYEIVQIASKTKYRAHALKLLNAHKLRDVKTWQWMIDQQIDITAGGNDAIQFAGENGHLSVVKFLVEHGADVTAGGNYAVELASENGHLSVVKFLATRGADITADDNLAIKWASKNGHDEVVKYLESKGATL